MSPSSFDINIGSIPVIYQADLEAIQPISSKPIRQIPQSLFENCNQAISNSYNSNYLQILKERVKTVSSKDIDKIGNQSSLHKTRKKEEFDWIYALVQMEESLQKIDNVDQVINALTVNEIMKYNSYVTRLTEANPGKLRQDLTLWHKKDFDINEKMALAIIHQILEASKATRVLPTLSIPGDDTKFELTSTILLSHLISIKENPQKLMTDDENDSLIKEQWENFKPTQAINGWLEEQGNQSPNLEMCAWIRKRVYYFADPDEIKSQLEEAIQFIQHAPKLHPIEKACYIWYKTIHIHVAEGANKRTGRLVGTLILLASGYLPPKISGEDGEKYVEMLEQSFSEESGHLRFTQFIVKLMKAQQNEHKNENI